MHGWLSAFAFVALLFFAVTGLVLNHPEWLGKGRPDTQEVEIALSAEEIARARAAADPAQELATIIAERVPTPGRYSSGELYDDEAQVRLSSPRGTTDVYVDLEAGVAEVEIRESGLMTMLNELHRGKDSGTAWRLVIDIAAVAMIVVSLFGFVLFLSLRTRLRQNLWLIALGTGALVLVLVFFVA